MNRYEQLTEDLKEAYSKALEVRTNDDGGTCNFDSTFLILKRWQERKVLEAIEKAGLYCRSKTKWIGEGYMINTGGGQANNRTRIRDEFSKALSEKGYHVLHFDMMD
ncbi:hypothetical protein [Clostridium kluyveri]|uniref:Uncharacterized protein n=2 Tax=Clostridium kluyveri TaxID=1534 RepID=A5N2G1_CLOK5|nr:hypothetical protein [Clostridium kluyveri]EDK35307.1 Hypothetical protein CKL_3304 [Clostridium kluyveri DSM 555]BAH07969.1 hypothetical protein CKR_2918 [Clostridium kluyveri NBRC 12016]